MAYFNFPDLKELSDDEIFDYFNLEVDEKSCYAFISHLLNERPDTALNPVAMFEGAPEYLDNNYQAIIEFAEKMRKVKPDLYRQEYGFIEQKITEHAFDSGNEKLLDRCLEIIAEDPVAGIDAVTMKTLYRLIFFGMYDKALQLSLKVYKPIAENERLILNPEIEFLTVIFMDGIEREYEKFLQGDTSGWETFNQKMHDLGINHEQKRIDIIFQSLVGKPDNDRIMREIKKEPVYGFIDLMYHFMKYMKSRYNFPFMVSNLWFHFLMNTSLFGHVKNDSSWFYIPYPTLDKHVTEQFDKMWLENNVEVGGKLWGLHYVYEFLREVDLISDVYYQQMIENLAALKMDFLIAISPYVWHLKFVTNWPESPANLLKLPKGFFKYRGKMDVVDAKPLVKQQLPPIPGEARITGEFKEAKAKKNEFIQQPFSQIAASEFPHSTLRKVGRNEPCPCGSGKKYKKCCLGKSG